MNKKYKNIKPRNNKGQPHGLWEYYWTNGNLVFKRFYHNGRKVGYEEFYNIHGKYIHGKLEEKRYNI